MDPVHLILIGIVALFAGAINALAGGGTLITFPTLTALGVPAVAANITNTVALSPGYFGGTLGQWKDLQGQRHRLWILFPAGVVGGLAGGYLLVHTGEGLFRALVPVLILFASLLLALQEPLRKRLQDRKDQSSAAKVPAWALILVFLASVYGGYFGAGLGVIMLAVLGLVLDDTLTRLNAIKQAMSFGINIAAAVFFLFSGQVLWRVAAVMSVGAVIGGVVGGRIAGRISVAALRWFVVCAGVIIAIVYFAKW